MIAITAAVMLISAAAAQQPQSAAFRLGGVQVAGASRYAESEVVRLSGLRSGQSVDLTALDTAAQRLADTGLFRRVSYKYVTTAGQLTVTFDIEEPKWTVPVVLDNFVWFTDQDLAERVRERVPSYDGTAPDSDAAPEFLKTALQSVIEAKKIPGRVEFTLQQNLKTQAVAFLFSVKDPSPVVCGLRIEGASALPEEELIAALRRSMPAEYSRSFLQSASAGTLTDMYRQRGHWRAAIAPPTAVLDAIPGCNGVAVVLQVEEGPPYAWAGARWNGNRAIAAAQLDRLFGLKDGDPAVLARIEEGVRRVHAGYEKQGYILQSAAYVPRLDEGARRATFEITVDEGPQFRMGTLEFVGFPDNLVERLNAKWRIKTGEVFDGSYPMTFVTDEIRPVLRTASPRLELRSEPGKPIVHLKFVIK